MQFYLAPHGVFLLAGWEFGSGLKRATCTSGLPAQTAAASNINITRLTALMASFSQPQGGASPQPARHRQSGPAPLDSRSFPPVREASSREQDHLSILLGHVTRGDLLRAHVDAANSPHQIAKT
jgi:hypothetical protein